MLIRWVAVRRNGGPILLRRGPYLSLISRGSGELPFDRPPLGAKLRAIVREKTTPKDLQDVHKVPNPPSHPPTDHDSPTHREMKCARFPY